jgi:hypothetical protein
MPLHFKDTKNEINIGGCGSFPDLRVQPAKKIIFCRRKEVINSVSFQLKQIEFPLPS